MPLYKCPTGHEQQTDFRGRKPPKFLQCNRCVEKAELQDEYRRNK